MSFHSSLLSKKDDEELWEMCNCCHPFYSLTLSLSLKRCYSRKVQFLLQTSHFLSSEWMKGSVLDKYQNHHHFSWMTSPCLCIHVTIVTSSSFTQCLPSPLSPTGCVNVEQQQQNTIWKVWENNDHIFEGREFANSSSSFKFRSGMSLFFSEHNSFQTSSFLSLSMSMSKVFEDNESKEWFKSIQRCSSLYFSPSLYFLLHVLLLSCLQTLVLFIFSILERQEPKTKEEEEEKF